MGYFMKNSIQWQSYDDIKLLEALRSDKKIGMSEKEANKRVEIDGENEIIGINKAPWYMYL